MLIGSISNIHTYIHTRTYIAGRRFLPSLNWIKVKKELPPWDQVQRASSLPQTCQCGSSKQHTRSPVRETQECARKHTHTLYSKYLANSLFSVSKQQLVTKQPHIVLLYEAWKMLHVKSWINFQTNIFNIIFQSGNTLKAIEHYWMKWNGMTFKIYEMWHKLVDR